MLNWSVEGIAWMSPTSCHSTLQNFISTLPTLPPLRSNFVSTLHRLRSRWSLALEGIENGLSYFCSWSNNTKSSKELQGFKQATKKFVKSWFTCKAPDLISRDCLGSHARLQMVHVHVTQVFTVFKRQVGAGDDGKGAPSWHLEKEELVAKELATNVWK